MTKMANDDLANIETFYWKGQKRYRCPLDWESGAKCAFNTPDHSALIEHMAKGGHTREAHKNVIETSAPSFTPPVSAETHEFVGLKFAEDIGESMEDFPAHFAPHAKE